MNATKDHKEHKDLGKGRFFVFFALFRGLARKWTLRPPTFPSTWQMHQKANYQKTYSYSRPTRMLLESYSGPTRILPASYDRATAENKQKQAENR